MPIKKAGNRINDGFLYPQQSSFFRNWKFQFFECLKWELKAKGEAQRVGSGCHGNASASLPLRIGPQWRWRQNENGVNQEGNAPN